jgi:hypothetical protein
MKTNLNQKIAEIREIANSDFDRSAAFDAGIDVGSRNMAQKAIAVIDEMQAEKKELCDEMVKFLDQKEVRRIKDEKRCESIDEIMLRLDNILRSGMDPDKYVGIMGLMDLNPGCKIVYNEAGAFLTGKLKDGRLVFNTGNKIIIIEEGWHYRWRSEDLPNLECSLRKRLKLLHCSGVTTLNWGDYSEKELLERIK